MPIKTLTGRLTEVGRLRHGRQLPVIDERTGRQKTKHGRPVTRPERLEQWRLTSPHEELLQYAAGMYGGEVGRWDGAPTEQPQWELFTESDRLRVIVPPRQVISQWLEHWSGGGCQRRCDGERETLGDTPCLCAAETARPEDYRCRPTTRLNLVLEDVPAVGVWRCELHGYHGAAELAGTVRLLEDLGLAGRVIPATLRLDPRSKPVPGKPTRHYVVPVLELSHGALLELAAQPVRPAAALGAPARAIQPPPPGQDPPAAQADPAPPMVAGGMPTPAAIEGLRDPQDAHDLLTYPAVTDAYRGAVKAVVGYDRWQRFWRAASLDEWRQALHAARRGMPHDNGEPVDWDAEAADDAAAAARAAEEPSGPAVTTGSPAGPEAPPKQPQLGEDQEAPDAR